MQPNLSVDLENTRIAWIGLRNDPLSVAVREVCRLEGNLVKTIYSDKAGTSRSAGSGGRAGHMDEGAERWTGNADRLNELLAAHGVNLLVIAGCHHLLAPETIRLVERGCYNVHPSLLPSYRGSNPIFWQYQRADLTAGVTVHAIDSGMDTGPICAQESFAVSLGEPLEKIVPAYAALAAKLVLTTLHGLHTGTLVATPQDHDACQFIARKTRPSDFLIDWGQWPLRRIWHFLRMGSFVADAALPQPPARDSPDGDSISPHIETDALPTRGRSRFAWKVGQMEPAPSHELPGSLWKDDRGWAIHHPEGRIRLERGERAG